MNNNRRGFGKRTVWQYLRECFGDNCVYCHRNVATAIDHVIPYSYSRYHGIENLRPSCPTCNLIASDKVFESFEQKYEFIREERHRRKSKKQLLTCSTCLLPYYSALCYSAFLCPFCHDLEYETRFSLKPSVKQWLEVLTRAGFTPSAHTILRTYVNEQRRTSIPIRDKVELLVSFSPLADDIVALVLG